MTPSREAIMTALFGFITGPPCIVNFTGTFVANSPLVSALSSTDGLFVGMPVSSRCGIPDETFWLTLSPPTLTQAATAPGTAVPMTQGFQTTGRRLQFWQDAFDNPAIFLRDSGAEYPPRPSGIPARSNSKPKSGRLHVRRPTKTRSRRRS